MLNISAHLGKLLEVVRIRSRNLSLLFSTWRLAHLIMDLEKQTERVNVKAHDMTMLERSRNWGQPPTTHHPNAQLRTERGETTIEIIRDYLTLHAIFQLTSLLESGWRQTQAAYSWN